MKYSLPSTIIPAGDREALNKKIVQLLGSSDMQGITPEDIFQAYTGDGGLHGLKRENYRSYHAFSEAKKDLDNGQYFTPAYLCDKIVGCIPVVPADLVADLTFGMGNFFNFLPTETNVYGCELDFKAFKVARFLYPDANLVNGDIRYYRPDVKFDVIFGNPPFNLFWKVDNDEVLSQLFFLKKSAELLTPGGVLAMIAPLSFLADDFTDSNFIKDTNEIFSFLGQAKLPAGAFAQMGVKKFETKVLFFQKRFEGITARHYSTTDFVDFDSISIQRDIISPALEQKHKVRYQVMFVQAGEQGVNNWSYKNSSLRKSDGFEFQIKKLFFEIKAHPVSRKNYSKAHNLLQKFRIQIKPEEMNWEEWDKVKLTEGKVLAQIKRLLNSALNPKPIRIGVQVAKTQHGLTIRSYDKDTTAFIKSRNIETSLPFHLLVDNENLLSQHPLSKHLVPFRKLVRRKRSAYLNQVGHFKNMPRNKAIDRKLDRFSFVHKDGQNYNLNPIQKEDVGLLLQKKYGGFLNWQQGAGKTVGAWASYKIIGSKFKNTIIVGPPIAIKMTWQPFIERQNESFNVITSISDVATIKPGDIVLIALTSVVKLQRFIKKYLRTIGYDALLIFDESDEITNYISLRSQAMRNVFRKVRYKMLTTGTTTRNNIAELYGQLELLHNNSYTFLCKAPIVYKEVRTPEDGMQIKSFKNEKYGKPFPARGGFQLFKSCFSPTKATIFGIAKNNQDIYNVEHLEEIIGSCILTRKFKDVVGPDKYEIHTHTISQKAWEIDFYKMILEEFHQLLPLFYSSTGSSRKDSMLRILRQLRTLIQACSIPHLMKPNSDLPRKAEKIVSMIRKMDARVMVGCTTKKAAKFYRELLQEKFPMREVFYITGESANFKSRQLIIDKFESSADGILVCTQMSLSSSVNIPSCDQVIVESLQYNLPRMEQFYYRTIRFDSKNKSHVHFIVYENSIEINIMTLLLDKERLNDFIKTLEFRSVEEVFGDFKLNLNFLDMLIEKIKDEEGNLEIKWGKQKLVA